MTGAPFPIIVPWRCTGPDAVHRLSLWNWCRARWELHFPDHPVVVCDDDHQPYSRARSRNLGALQAGSWDVAVFADADIAFAGTHQVHQAARRALRTGNLVYAHRTRAQLDEAATGRLLAGELLNAVPIERQDADTYSGIYAVPRNLWDDIGGFDETFRGWGFEDLCFMIACGSYAGVDRVAGRIYHLWHPRGDEENPHNAVNQARWERYMAARWDRAAVAAVRAS